jgi:hypothetical protein
VRIRVLIASVVLLVVATAAQAVDLSGKWVGTATTSTVYCEPPPTSSGEAELTIAQVGNSFSGTFMWTFLNPLACHPTTDVATPILSMTGTVSGTSFHSNVPIEDVVGGYGFIDGSVIGNVMTFTFVIPVSIDHDNPDDDIDTIVTAQLTRVPPPITASISAGSLWPPNHKMVDVGLIRDATSTFAIYSDEDDAGEPDAAGSLLLRAERTGTGDGRVYLIAVTTADGLENTCLTVVVPKSQSARDIAAVNAQAAAALAQCPSPAGYFVVGN